MNIRRFFFGDFTIVSEGRRICEAGTEPLFECIEYSCNSDKSNLKKFKMMFLANALNY